MLSRNEVKQALRQQRIEAPSWAYGNTGRAYARSKHAEPVRTERAWRWLRLGRLKCCRVKPPPVPLVHSPRNYAGPM